ncbi:hypothetical protein G7Y89_g12889 [Cudoniella acicularis]|uniref:Uncharacterized protein n=1 Tax=Cudoniella acicularis TaxID=354080 RepID=A0A8H4R7Y0_9HELO|nr:hypothetical protein G7Y89_g12889 [Cudoniella acicularis]
MAATPTPGDHWPVLFTPEPQMPTYHQAKETSTSTPTPTTTVISSSLLTDQNFNNPDTRGFWERLEGGGKIGIALTIVIVILAIIIGSAWYCCNCCGYRTKRRRRNLPPQGFAREGILPLHTIPSANTIPNPRSIAVPPTMSADVPPPSYEEAVPRQHQRILNNRDEEDGVIADGKTPLSEIPFEDVVLEHASSNSSGSRNFHQTHHGWGNTQGHTNS